MVAKSTLDVVGVTGPLQAAIAVNPSDEDIIHINLESLSADTNIMVANEDIQVQYYTGKVMDMKELVCNKNLIGENIVFIARRPGYIPLRYSVNLETNCDTTVYIKPLVRDKYYLEDK